MTYNRNPNKNRWNGQAGETSNPYESTTFIFFEPLDRPDIAASIETYSTRNGRKSAFSVYRKRATGAGDFYVWERESRLANMVPADALEMLKDFRDGKALRTDEL